MGHNINVDAWFDESFGLGNALAMNSLMQSRLPSSVCLSRWTPLGVEARRSQQNSAFEKSNEEQYQRTPGSCTNVRTGFQERPPNTRASNRTKRDTAPFSRRIGVSSKREQCIFRLLSLIVRYSDVLTSASGLPKAVMVV